MHLSLVSSLFADVAHPSIILSLYAFLHLCAYLKICCISRHAATATNYFVRPSIVIVSLLSVYPSTYVYSVVQKCTYAYDYYSIVFLGVCIPRDICENKYITHIHIVFFYIVSPFVPLFFSLSFFLFPRIICS